MHFKWLNAGHLVRYIPVVNFQHVLPRYALSQQTVTREHYGRGAQTAQLVSLIYKEDKKAKARRPLG